MRIEMPAAAGEIISELNNAGYEAYIVGGCVRDAVLGISPKDWDITTSAEPAEVKKHFPRTVDTGIRHGTVTVLHKGGSYEVTTYRIDGEYTDSRHPKEVIFTARLGEDLRRRDFTINAMAYSHETGLIDLYGGRADLDARIIRCVGSAESRFGEDALRILRAVRFSAQLGFGIETETSAAIYRLAPTLSKISRERIRDEFGKIVFSDNPDRLLYAKESGIMKEVLPWFGMEDALEAARTLKLSAKTPAAVRWSLLLRASKDCVADMRSLKMDNETIRQVKLILEYKDMREEPADCPALRRMLSRTGYEIASAIMEHRSCFMPEELEKIRHERRLLADIKAKGDCVAIRDMDIDGNDLIRLGLPSGKEVGSCLSLLFDEVLEHPEVNTRSRLEEMARSLIKEMTGEAI